MKKVLVLWLSLILLAGLGAASASAAAPKEGTDVQVLLGGQPVAFLQDPVVSGDKVFVEFRTLFEKFGYSIDYVKQTRTIKATAPGHRIEMSLNGDVAFVDGKVIDSKGEWMIVGDRALVGTDFLAALSGRAVDWDETSRVVEIADRKATPEQEAAVLQVFDKLQLAEAAGDNQGLAALFASDTPLDLKQMLPDFSKIRTRTTYSEKNVISYSDNVAVVEVRDQTVRLSGAYFLDNQTHSRYTLHKDTDGNWKIFNVEMLEGEVINAERLFDLAVTVPEADKSAIEAVLQAQVKAANEENVDATLQTMTFGSEDQKKQTAESLKAIFGQTDSATKVNKTAIVEFEAGKSATLVISTTVEVKAGGSTVKSEVLVQNKAKYVNGKWLLDPETFVLSNKPL
ncbi:copper amine oxidase N-terminal domain-containing protein [Cohnella sp. CFH 77786]|uniref:copper amine oxidase N-terminal domain-containing protein n=1 Tax=Cohnella sp. CFH 77786 TaxID=2662265 RepID=UPI001C60897A|nr:copper amine oxidase N-terminal domain-containing protein [Cohnella sp. CFH 77786]